MILIISEIPTQLVVDSDGKAHVEQDNIQETLSEEDIQKAKEVFENAETEKSIADIENKSYDKVQEEMLDQLEEKINTQISGGGQEIDYIDEQEALSALNNYYAEFNRNNMIDMILDMIKEEQSNGVHKYDDITEEKINNYTQDELEILFVKLLKSR